MVYFLYLFGLLPSILWLIFYLRRDAHPESNKTILKVFFYGMLIGFLVILLEKIFSYSIDFLKNQEILYFILIVFVGVALIEEYFKYFVVKLTVLKNSELDEPFDIFLYMIISALGFAALENILVLRNFHPFLNIQETMILMILRFVFATFLHTLSSGLFGFFLTLSFLNLKNRKIFFWIGLLSATLFHGFYNLSLMVIMAIGGFEIYILPISILAILGLFILCSIRRLKKMKSICKI